MARKVGDAYNNPGPLVTLLAWASRVEIQSDVPDIPPSAKDLE